MTQPRYTLSYEAHLKNLCSGLTSLQLNGEFVDMTIAADGHFVKVHKMIMAIASPYFKDIISSAEGHPVIFLNKVSFATLSSLLEYIYMGKAFVEPDKLEDFIQAGKELHIKGLEDILPQQYLLKKPTVNKSNNENENSVAENANTQDDNENTATNTESFDVELYNVDVMDDAVFDKVQSDIEIEESTSEKIDSSGKKDPGSLCQYSVSNWGTIHLIFNRYIYSFNYTQRDGNSRHWRCIDNRKSRCPATIVTKNDSVIKRRMAHNHTFHDKQILKKVKKNAIFSTISDLQKHITVNNKPKEDNCTESE